MRDRMERFVLLPFTVGCISESSIALGMQNVKRPKMDASLTLARIREGKKEEEEEEYLDDEESLSGEKMKSQLYQMALPRFQKLFRNFSQLFVYKDEFEPKTDEFEPETGMEIGLPTDVKHVTHIGLDGCASTILSKGWNNLAEKESIDIPSFRFTSAELAMATQPETPKLRS